MFIREYREYPFHGKENEGSIELLVYHYKILTISPIYWKNNRKKLKKDHDLHSKRSIKEYQHNNAASFKLELKKKEEEEEEEKYLLLRL